MKSDSRQKWGGTYKDFNWEIVKWFTEDKECWNSYIYITDEVLVKRLWSRKRRMHGRHTCYLPKDILEDLPWHGGQTFYHQVIDNDKRHIQIGDDYLHLWDKDKTYNEEILRGNIEGVIDALVKALEVNP